MITRRDLVPLFTAMAAALTAQPANAESTAGDDLSTITDALERIRAGLYGADHPLAQGETLTLADPPLQVAEISRRVARTGNRPGPSGDVGAEALLRYCLDHEVYRWCAAEWVGFQRALRMMAILLRDAGVPDAQALAAVGELDEAGTELYVAATAHMLDLGLDVGKKIASNLWPSLIFAPGDRYCPECHGAGVADASDGDDAPDCPRCDGAGLVEPGPALMWVYLPDGLLEAEDKRAATAV